MPFEEVTEVLYTTAATAKGGREGNVKSADGVVDLPLGKPGSVSNPKANPETLFAAGYAACFSGALNAVAKAEGLDTSESTVTADVTFGKTESGFGLAVDLKATVPGVDPAKAQELVEKAHQFCPYSKATRDNITVTLGTA
ncbi:organic hydroperoxide resistance protein [Luteipulveratus mongoliensis]|uniref:Organic hydroperoxide resistance protein n=1 Tax=Luteipulveratus mongoliensis TaxID=571913 RepID=A0A0K1JLZ4_9MICO|nr:organic hydroperoxide resistance protein [Luteipulveratus mongoliensis]AKU17726.1 organic hydroperoxide resistance protein [Luteipulveratus mongoliensis]